MPGNQLNSGQGWGSADMLDETPKILDIGFGIVIPAILLQVLPLNKKVVRQSYHNSARQG